MCANFPAKRTTLTFWPRFAPKMDFGLEIQKTDVEIRISILEMCVPICRYYVCQFSGKTYNFDFFGPNLPKNEFWGQNFKILSPDSESAAPKSTYYQTKKRITFLYSSMGYLYGKIKKIEIVTV